ncbi:DUF3450 domain-containing protein [Vibrio sp. S17_S38]|uniref:DUF3450 domain-containing protein n=1 Tax=Vibrio sp. S17_S38 TaxID=2720229 RepID=UPI00167FFF54|nr:DUF3450 domain-containing protein [Vibrio sp. S17_S38]MBD1574293.1 DUF3450 domain-containing protein [Vibrio sp. S17_S38]
MRFSRCFCSSHSSLSSAVRQSRLPLYATASLILLGLTTAFSAQADSLDNARSTEVQTNKVAKSSQVSINKNSDESFELQAEVEQLEAQIDNLSIYQRHLKKLVDSQEQEKVATQSQIEEIAQTRQGVVPLMYYMLDGYKKLIHEGTPVRMASREKRLDDLQQLMGRADISEAEKYRRILEAYQVEIDYGTKLGSYAGEITLADNDNRQVDLLYLGRVSLLARSKDAQHTWVWSQSSNQWQAVDGSQQVEINKAYALANKQQAPTLLNLPLSITQVKAVSENKTQEAK